MNEQQLKERVEEIRKIVAKVSNPKDREKLLKMVDKFEAAAQRFLAGKD